jgi:hypothetical protein
MTESGNKKHRYSYSGGVKALEESKWGRAKAFERCGKPQFFDSPPPPASDGTKPQFKDTDGQGPGYSGNAKRYNSTTKGGR